MFWTNVHSYHLLASVTLKVLILFLIETLQFIHNSVNSLWHSGFLVILCLLSFCNAIFSSIFLPFFKWLNIEKHGICALLLNEWLFAGSFNSIFKQQCLVMPASLVDFPFNNPPFFGYFYHSCMYLYDHLDYVVGLVIHFSPTFLHLKPPSLPLNENN